MPFPSPLAPLSYNSLLKETSLGCAELSTAAICKDATRRSSTSQFTGWTAVGNGHSLDRHIAYAPQALPIEQTRVVSLSSLSACVHACGGSYLDSHLFEEGTVFCVF